MSVVFVALNQGTLPIIWAFVPYAISKLLSLRGWRILLANQKWKSKLQLTSFECIKKHPEVLWAFLCFAK